MKRFKRRYVSPFITARVLVRKEPFGCRLPQAILNRPLSEFRLSDMQARARSTNLPLFLSTSLVWILVFADLYEMGELTHEKSGETRPH